MDDELRICLEFLKVLVFAFCDVLQDRQNTAMSSPAAIDLTGAMQHLNVNTCDGGFRQLDFYDLDLDIT